MIRAKDMTKTVMALGAHPDDIEIGAGGTLAALANDGYQVIFVDYTNGEPTPHGTVEKRMQEAESARQIIGASERVVLDLKNRELFDTVEARKKVATLMRKYRPEILFAPYYEDGHPDHLSASSLSLASRFYSKLSNTDMEHEPYYPGKVFYYYAFHLQVKVQPSFVFDISSTFHKKMDSITAYESQFVTHEGNRRVLKQLETDALYWGKCVGVEYGEPFTCRDHLCVKESAALFSM